MQTLVAHNFKLLVTGHIAQALVVQLQNDWLLQIAQTLVAHNLRTGYWSRCTGFGCTTQDDWLLQIAQIHGKLIHFTNYPRTKKIFVTVPAELERCL